MTKSQADQIKKIIDTEGWQAVLDHPVLGKVWAKTIKESREYTNDIDRDE